MFWLLILLLISIPMVAAIVYIVLDIVDDVRYSRMMKKGQ